MDKHYLAAQVFALNFSFWENAMENKNCIIKVENLGYTYSDSDETSSSRDRHPALTGVSLEIERGEYISILGHNGSGKSTLAKLLNLILVPTVGKIFIDGKDVSSPDITEEDVFEVRKKIAMVFQNPDNQLVATIVEEDVAFGPENLGLPRDVIRRRVVDSLNLVGMQEYARHAPHKLSGGQKQRIAIAGVIAMRPDVIIFDESTAMLDPVGRRDVIEIMERLNKEEGITVINITHYMDEAVRADRVIVVNDGRLVIDATPETVFSNIELLHSMGLEAPQSTELIAALKKSGIDFGVDFADDEKCYELLYAYLKDK